MNPWTLACVFLAAAACAQSPRPGPPAAARSWAVLLVPQALAPGEKLGYPLAALDLKRQLDAARRAGPIVIGGRSWLFGPAADADFRHIFLAVQGGRDRRLDPIVRPGRLLHGGIDLVFSRARVYRVRVKPRWSDWLHDSVVTLTPAQGSRGPGYRTYAADLLDMVERKAVYFRQGGREFYLAFLSDVDARTMRPAKTRSLVFFEERRFRPRLWRLPERALARGVAVRVRLAGSRLILLRRPDGLLVVYSGA